MKITKSPGKTLLLAGDSRSPAAEAFRTLRTNIQFAGIDKPLKKIMVAGPVPGCGKTTTLVNLGLALAKTGSSVLLVDTDLRKPDLHKLFKFRNEQGLTSHLFDSELELDRIIYQSIFDNVCILSSGPIPPNPSELIASAKFREMVQTLSASYDYLLFDTPPVNAATDPAILSQLVDATIFVIRYGIVTREEALYALDQLKKVDAHIIGAVMNALPSKNGAYYYYYEYGSEQ